MEQHPLIKFYLNNSRTPEGYTLEDIWGWSHENLEYVHTYIQWLFPMRERSGFNTSAPTLDDAAIAQFKSDPQLRTNLLRSFRLMLDFYGFELHEDKSGEVRIRQTQDFEQKSSYWLNPYNHNFLRITRILKSLTILGYKNYAEHFLLCLNDLYSKRRHDISENTFSYWNNAVRSD